MTPPIYRLVIQQVIMYVGSEVGHVGHPAYEGCLIFIVFFLGFETDMSPWNGFLICLGPPRVLSFYHVVIQFSPRNNHGCVMTFCGIVFNKCFFSFVEFGIIY